ncbi:MAG: HepT-like ribonuclease domain-containing protein [Thermoguttaceae bacterium]
MRQDDLVRLRHMLDAANEAQKFIHGRRREDLDHDRQLVWALVKAVEIIGEAASQLSDEAKTELPGLPWPKIIGMRHRLVHAYFDINLDILWQTIIAGLPPIVTELKRLIPGED